MKKSLKNPNFLSPPHDVLDLERVSLPCVRFHIFINEGRADVLGIHPGILPRTVGPLDQKTRFFVSVSMSQNAIGLITILLRIKGDRRGQNGIGLENVRSNFLQILHVKNGVNAVHGRRELKLIGNIFDAAQNFERAKKVGSKLAGTGDLTHRPAGKVSKLANRKGNGSVGSVKIVLLAHLRDSDVFSGGEDGFLVIGLGIGRGLSA
jgi:hypothetical protein